MKKFNAKGAARKALVADGWPLIEDGERYHGGFTHDWQGFGDWVCYCPTRGQMMVQVCMAAHRAAHLKKALENPLLTRWLGWGHRAETWVYPSKEDREEGNVDPLVVVHGKPPIDKAGAAR